jgi:hypothetical protein
VGEEVERHKGLLDKSGCRHAEEGREEDGSRGLTVPGQEQVGDSIDPVRAEDMAEGLAEGYTGADGSRSISGQDKT